MLVFLIGCCGTFGVAGTPSCMALKNVRSARVFAAAPCNVIWVVPETAMSSKCKGPPAYIRSEFTNLQLRQLSPSSDCGIPETSIPVWLPDGRGGTLGIEAAKPGPQNALTGSRSCAAASTVTPFGAGWPPENKRIEQTKPATNAIAFDIENPSHSLRTVVVRIVAGFAWSKSAWSAYLFGNQVVAKSRPMLPAKDAAVVHPTMNGQFGGVGNRPICLHERTKLPAWGNYSATGQLLLAATFPANISSSGERETSRWSFPGVGKYDFYAKRPLILGFNIQNTNPSSLVNLVGLDALFERFFCSVCGTLSSVGGISISSIHSHRIGGVENERKESDVSSYEFGTLEKLQIAPLALYVEKEPFYLSLDLFIGVIFCWIGLALIFTALCSNLLTREISLICLLFILIGAMLIHSRFSV